jgi:hypothetical protein
MSQYPVLVSSGELEVGDMPEQDLTLSQIDRTRIGRTD